MMDHRENPPSVVDRGRSASVASYAGRKKWVKKAFTNGKGCGILSAISETGDAVMAKNLLTSVYFFFFSFTYYFMGKAYLGFTGKRRRAGQAA